MLFNSFEFLIFYPVVTLVYFLLSQKFRWLWLLAASCYFYMFFKPIYILILAATIVIDYFAGLQLGKLQGKARKWMLILSIVANVGVLVVFKYYNFFAENINSLLSVGGLNLQLKYLDILLPIGLSFHTFQAMSYTIEVYRGHQQPEKHFGIYALYVMFYPQLVAGPIERPQNILHQFHIKQSFDADNLTEGLKLMLWGLFKKLFVADRLSVYVGMAYETSGTQTGSTLLMAAFFFAIQIYCDFSGYSDIARGAAKTMGYDLLINFRRPYLATNITDFWRRWHISLSTWFRDYVYFPLGGNKTSNAKWAFNILVVFLLSGIWHGANWTFVVWGLIHGILTIGHKFFSSSNASKAPKQKHFLQQLPSIIFTFILVMFAWIFFRAADISQALFIIKKIITNWHSHLQIKSRDWLAISLLGIAIVLLTDIIAEYNLNIKLLGSRFTAVRLITVSLMIIGILLFGVLHNVSFIYFQF